jgi:hypothetical protein
MRVLEDTTVYGLSLQEARRFTEEEKAEYTEWFREEGLVGLADGIPLHHISRQDDLLRRVQSRGSIGQFRGCSNLAYEVTDEEWNELLARDQQAARVQEIRALEESIAGYRAVIANCEAAPKLYTEEEAHKKAVTYNNVFNEGGEGFVPHFYTEDEYEGAKAGLQKSLEALEGLR